MNKKIQEALADLRKELDAALLQHAHLEKRIAKLRASIASLEQLDQPDDMLEAHDSVLKKMLVSGAQKEIGLTDLIRQILKGASKPLVVREVKQAVIDRGFDVKRYQNISAAIPIVLKRLRNQGEAQIVVQTVGGKKFAGYVHIPTEGQK